MIDLHSHLLPGIDDGAKDVSVSLEMARLAVAEGIEVMACTPHFYSGVYDNLGDDVLKRLDDLSRELNEHDIPLKLVCGGDIRMDVNLVEKLKKKEILTLNHTRYVLIEPPHHSYAAHLDRIFLDLLMAGYVPILTHPERLTWIENKFDVIERCFENGVLMQLTSSSITGDFGQRPTFWAHKMLKRGMVHIVATDAHDPSRRPPKMKKCYAMLVDMVGEAEALAMVQGRPAQILADADPKNLALTAIKLPEKTGLLKSLWQRTVYGKEPNN